MVSMKTRKRLIVRNVQKAKPDRKKVSLYLSEKLFSDFKDFCAKEDVSASKVMEELIRDLLETEAEKD